MKSDTFILIKKLKESLFKWRLLAFIAIFLVVISSSSKILNNSNNKNIIARVSIDTPIVNGFFSYDSLKKLEGDNVKAIILNIDSSGGDVVESEKLYLFFRKLSKTKPVVSVINGMGASGAYMVAMASDYIVSYNTSAVGSIGVIIQTYEITDLAKKLGISLTTYKSSILKAAPNMLEKVNPDVDMVMSQQINDVYDYFLNIFVERRKIKITEAQEIANGQIYTGRQALEYGLVDKIGTEEDALNFLKDNKIDVDNINIVDYDIYKKSNSGIISNFINSKINSIGGFSRIMAIYK